MIHKRGVLPALILLAMVVIGAGMQIAFGSSGAGAAGSAAPAATPAPPRVTGQAVAVVRSLAAVQRAFNAGELPRLCRRGGLVDPAVIRRQNAEGPGCEAELEALMANAPPLRLTVRRLALRPDLASVTVTNARGGEPVVDLVRRGSRWLLSFSDGSDPMPALAGTE